MHKVKEIMSTDVITISPETDIITAAKTLLDNHINGVPVVDAHGALVGLLCQSDLIAQQKRFPIPSLFTLLDGFIPISSLKSLEKDIQKITAVTVEQAMTKDPVQVHSEATIEEAATLMVDKYYHSLPIVDQGKLIGIIGKEDLLKYLVKHLNQDKKPPE